MKKLLILGGANVHCKLVEAAHEMNLYVIVIDFLKREESPAKLLADKSYEIDINDLEKIIQICKKEKVDAVISTHLDPCQKPYQRICEELGLLCLGTRQQFEYLTNKCFFKKLCQNYNIGVIPEYKKDDLYHEIYYPVFVKPVDSRGSRGQAKCENIVQALEAIEVARSESSNADFIIEKYYEDISEIQVTYFFINGVPYLIRTADSYHGNGKMGNVITYGVSPSKYTLEYKSTIHSKIVRMLKGIGIENGPVMLQGFYDEGEFRFFDSGFRFPGVDYERIYKNEYKVDLLKLVIEFSLTGKMSQTALDEESVFLNGKKVLTVFPLISAGEIGRIEGLANIERDERVVSILLRHHEGDIIEWTYDINQRLCEIDIMIEEETVEEIMNKIFFNLKVYDKNGKNMIIR